MDITTYFSSVRERSYILSRHKMGLVVAPKQLLLCSTIHCGNKSSFVFKNGQWAPLPFLEFNLLGIGSKGSVAIENGKTIPKLNKLTYPMGQYVGGLEGPCHTHPSLKVRWGSQLALGLI